MKIAHFGTFDVPNYGDLLFPLIAHRRLAASCGATLVSVSPVGGPPVFADTPPSIGFDEFAARIGEFDGILIGGGNILRTSPTVLAEYQAGATPVTAYPDLWLGATALSTHDNLPVCWNAPGVLEPFGEQFANQIRSCLSHSAYVSVRDETSRSQLLAAGGDTSIELVPDTAWEVDEIWPASQLKTTFDGVFSSRGRETPTAALAFHLNDRYLSGVPAAVIAEQLDETCRQFSATAILLAMGRCHGDHELAIRIGSEMRSAPVILDNPSTLCEIVACIAHSIAYVGSSMHGFITASAFGVPAICVASPSVTKFEGVMRWVGLPDALQQKWSDACELLKTLNLSERRDHLKQVRPALQGPLDRHWARVAALFQDNLPTHGDTSGASTHELLESYRTDILSSVAQQQFQLATRGRAAERALARARRALEDAQHDKEDAVRAKEEVLRANKLLASYRNGVLSSIALEQFQKASDGRAAQRALDRTKQALEDTKRTLERTQQSLEEARRGRTEELRAKEEALRAKARAERAIQRQSGWLHELFSVVDAIAESKEWKAGARMRKIMRKLGFSARDGRELLRRARKLRRDVVSWERQHLPPPNS